MTNKELIVRMLNMCKTDLVNSNYVSCDSNLTVLLSLVDKMDVQETAVTPDPIPDPNTFDDSGNS